MTSTLELSLQPESADNSAATEARLIALVLDGVTSEHSRRSYRAGLARFFAWFRMEGTRAAGQGTGFTKATVQHYRATLIADGLSAATVNLRLSPIRKLARKLADNQLLDPLVASSIKRIPGVEKRGTRIGNWLMKDQANQLLNGPAPETLAGKRDRAMLALLLGCGLRRGELLRLTIENLQQREGRWVIPDLLGKGNRIRTVTVPAGAKVRIDFWLQAAGVTAGRIFRPVNKSDLLAGTEIKDEKAVCRWVLRYANQTELGKLAPHDLRRTCAKLRRQAGGDLEQIQILLGHASLLTTAAYLGTEQALVHAVNDAVGLDMR